MPSSKVVPVASCHRAIPSVTEYFIRTPRITAHKTAGPRMLPTREPVAKSPPPNPVAAKSRPGPSIDVLLANFKLPLTGL